jgi:MOSC domain-containing protein YiiM
MEDARLVSVQIGMPTRIAPQDGERAWISGIFKTPVRGPIWLHTLNLEGDAQADLRVHGGPFKAVLAYSADHYPFWKERLPGVDFEYGAFGENFTVSGLTEDTVCADDIFRIGQAELCVTQPRQPCWKLARKLTRDIGPLVIGTGYSGWYLSVLREGYVQAGDAITLLDRPNPDWTIRRVNDDLIQA